MRWSLSKEKTSLEKIIDGVETRLLTTELDSPDYVALMDKLEKLYKLKVAEYREPISRDVLTIAVTNLAGILLIIAYEQKHVITSKGFGQLLKPKIPSQQ